MEDGKILDNEWKSQVPGGHCFDDYLAPTLAGFESGTLGIPSVHLNTRPLRTLVAPAPMVAGGRVVVDAVMAIVCWWPQSRPRL